jgi:hypothetical protein
LTLKRFIFPILGLDLPHAPMVRRVFGERLSAPKSPHGARRGTIDSTIDSLRD